MTPKETANYELIKTAIENRLSISFIHDRKDRTVEPYLVGYAHSYKRKEWDKGTIKLRAYILSGESSEPYGVKAYDRWRKYDLIKMSNIELNEKSTNGNKEYNPNDNDFIEISCRVSVPGDYGYGI